MTKLYCFVLGFNHILSKIEILSILKKQEVKYRILEASEEILILELQSVIDGEFLINRTGGIVKIGEIFTIAQFSKSDEVFSRDLLNALANKLLPERLSRSYKFSISIYNAGAKLKYLYQLIGKKTEIGRTLKRILSGSAPRPYFLDKRERIISCPTVKHAKLLKNGFELLICPGQKGIYIGKTVAIQDYESFSLRDYGRPNRNIKAGMIPPKLARMMINIASPRSDARILDPFCGSGTILQELVMLGYKNITGADIDPAQLENSERNLTWLFDHYPHISKEKYKIALNLCDARKLSQIFPYSSIDAVITEPYLGPPDSGRFSPFEIGKEINLLESLYQKTFAEFVKIIKPGGVVVTILPVFYLNRKSSFLNLQRVMPLGLTVKNMANLISGDINILCLEVDKRVSVIYYHPDQSIYREIIVLEKIL